jgi:hypothetical protein
VKYAPTGLRGLAISNDGRFLYATAPEKPSRYPKDGQIIIIDLSPNPQKLREKKWSLITAISSGGQEPYTITTTTDPKKILFTNKETDAKGFGVLTINNNDPQNFSASVKNFALNLGKDNDYFDVNNGVGIAFLPGVPGSNHPEDYAFVTGANIPNTVTIVKKGFDVSLNLRRDQDQLDPVRPAGGNIGIIRDPLGNAKLIAATRPIPLSFPDNLVF